MRLNQFLMEGEGDGTTGTSGAGSSDGTGANNSGGGDSGGGAGGGSALPADPWLNTLETLSPELRGFIETKGFKGVEPIINSYVNLEKLTGAPAEEIFRIPPDNNPDAIAKVMTRLGRPETVEGYKDALVIPDGDNGEFAQALMPVLHGAGLTKDQARKLSEGWNEHMLKIDTENTAQYEATLQTETDNLKRDWGAQYDKNVAAGKATMVEFGISQDQVAEFEKQIGFASTMKLFANIGAKLGEAVFHGSEGDLGGSADPRTPEGAAAQIEMLKADKMWVAKYIAGDAEAKAQMERLQRTAFPGEAGDVTTTSGSRYG